MKVNNDWNLTEIQPSYLINEMFIQPKTCWTIEKNYYSNGNQFKRKICKGSLEIFLFVQIRNFLTDLCCILAAFKHKYLKGSLSQARLCYCFDLKLRSNYSSNVTKRLNSSTGKNINCSLKLKFLRLFLILVPVKGLSIIFSAFWRLFKKLELKECLCS